MAQTYKTEGIVLKRWAYKERDKMVRLFTRDYGKLSARAISARKLTSKLAGHLEPFVESSFFLARLRTIDIVAGSSTLAANAQLRQSLQHNALASFFVEVVDKSTQEADVDDTVYNHVRDFLQWLNTNAANTLALYAAVLQLFALLGYKVELYNCHHCKRPVADVSADGNKFHYLLWNVECADCTSADHTLPMTAATIKTMRFLSEQPFTAATRLQLADADWREVHGLVRSMLQYHFDKPLKSEPALALHF